MSEEFELYTGKSYKDLLKDIVSNTENKRDQIDIVISDLRDQIKSISDAVVLAPIIQSYLDISIKNDAELVKLAGILQRLMSAQAGANNGDEYGLTDEEKSQLLKDIKDVQLDSKTPVEIKSIEKK